MRARTVEDVFVELAREVLRDVRGDSSGLTIDRLSEFAVWPPNLFALTSVLLAESGAYRHAVSPPRGRNWPPKDRWAAGIQTTGTEWTRTAANRREPPTEVGKQLELIVRAKDEAVRDLGKETAWSTVQAILTLHALADEACSGVGIPVERELPQDESFFLQLANNRLARSGSLAEIPTDVVGILPKLRTPQVGMSIRSLSHNIGMHRSEVDVTWEIEGGVVRKEDRRLNLLIVPFPFAIENRAFKVARGRLENMDAKKFGFFDFAPEGALNVTELAEAITEAQKRAGVVHGLVFPEASLTPGDLRRAKAVAERKGVAFIVAGVRGPERNEAYLGTWLGRAWTERIQPKHHRWCLDERQIRTYKLTSALHPKVRWWENIGIAQRQLRFLTLNEWLTVCHLICEDLARQDPVAHVVRTVGPTLIIALLLDGPQLRNRWPAQYAGVMADDPGSSVLTVTSLGMALRSVPAGKEPSRVIGLWRDPQRDPEELTIAEGAFGVLLTLCADDAEEWTADGRRDHGASTHLIFGGSEQIMLPKPRPTEAPARKRLRAQPAASKNRTSSAASQRPSGTAVRRVRRRGGIR